MLEHSFQRSNEKNYAISLIIPIILIYIYMLDGFKFHVLKFSKVLPSLISRFYLLDQKLILKSYILLNPSKCIHIEYRPEY